MHEDDLTAATSLPRGASHRPYLVNLAYQMLGDVGEAEDVAQEAFLRLSRADADGDRRRPRLADGGGGPAVSGPTPVGAGAARDHPAAGARHRSRQTGHAIPPTA